MTMEQEMQNTAAAIREQMVKDGLLPAGITAKVPQTAMTVTVESGPCCMLTPEEVVLVRKVLQAANLLFTVADTEYHENKIDALLRKLKEAEHVC